MTLGRHNRTRGFALVLTLSLLALLVLAVFATTMLVRISVQVSNAQSAQFQARQNALVGMRVALAQLQIHAGPDRSTTAQADIVATVNAANKRWTGAYNPDLSSEMRWLVSGDADPLTFEPRVAWLAPTGSNTPWRFRSGDNDQIALLAEGTVLTGTSDAPAYAPGDAVIVPKQRVPLAGESPELSRVVYAYWVGDEGVKLSLAPQDVRNVAPANGFVVPKYSEFGGTFDLTTKNTTRALVTSQLSRNAIGVDTATLKRRYHEVTLNACAVLSDPTQGSNSLREPALTEAGGENPYLSFSRGYDGLLFPVGSSDTTPNFLKGTRMIPASEHPTVEVTSQEAAGAYLLSGAFNINSTSPTAWRAMLEPARVKQIFGSATASTLTGADMDRLSDAYVQQLRQRGRPFVSIAELKASGVLARLLLDNTVVKSAVARAATLPERYTEDDLLALIAPTVVSRSDTFKIRAYGESVDPIDGKTVATAFCEAVVQRMPELIDDTLGRRFVITYFRWLGPDDI